MKQNPLFPEFDDQSRRASEQGKQDGMGRVERHAPISFRNNAEKALYYVAQRRPSLTTDAPRAIMLAWGNPKPPEGRAWGPIMQNAQRWGWIEWTPETDKTVERQANRRPKTVWKSLIYQGRR